MATKDQEVEYILRYGGRCRDCADCAGTCPSSGLPCDVPKARELIRRILDAREYGYREGYLRDNRW